MNSEINYEVLSNKIVNKFAKDIKNEFGYICCGEGGSMPYDIISLSIDFSAFHKASIQEARDLEIKLVEKFLNLINSDEEIRPYLREYPFTSNRVQISISFIQKKDNEHYPTGISYVSNINNIIRYTYDDRIKDELVDIHQEPYSEALRIIKNANENAGTSISKTSKENKASLNFPKKVDYYPIEKECDLLMELGRKTDDSLSMELKDLITNICDPYFGENEINKIASLEKEKFNGEYIEKWPNDQIKLKVTLKNGIADGHFHGWYENGDDAFKGFFRNGMKAGVHMSFFTNNYGGKCARVLTYNENGKLEGMQSSSQHMGFAYAFYKNGILDGEVSASKDFKDIRNLYFKDGNQVVSEKSKK